jgi:hypothetical protein
VSSRPLKGQVGAAGSIGQDAVNGSEIYQKKIEITADAFLALIFEDAEGIVVTCNAEEGFKARRWRPGKPLKGVVYYCISTVADTNPRDDVLPRQAQYLVKTYAVVLDDVGTKVDKAKLKGKLEPTFKLRTSMPEGISNEQWVYVFEYGVEPARAAALIEALAIAGLTDAGAKRADRIMRLPGSVNEKYSPPFICEVLEAHPERLYGYAEVAIGLGVTPTDTPALPTGPMALPDGMVDPIDQWNHDNGRVTGPMNPRGWYPLTCPLEGEHTGAVDHGCDYKAGLPGVFKCQHEHKAAGFELTTAWYRSWIKEQDPGADLSVVPRAVLEGLGEKLAAALGLERSSDNSAEQRSENGTPPTLSEVAFKALQEQLAGSGLFPLVDLARPPTPQEDTAQGILQDIIHVASESRFWSRVTDCLIDAKAVDNRWYPIMEAAGLLFRPKRQPMMPHQWLMQNPGMERVSRIVHRLGKPRIVDDCLNIAPALPERAVGEGAPEPWLDLVSFVCNDVEADIELVLDWMAFVVTAWDEKPGWHLLFKGEHGTGKNLALRPIVNHLMPDHWDKISATDIDGQFTTHQTKRLVQVDELQFHTRGTISTHDIYNKLKAWTARGTELVVINDKNIKRYTALDRSCWAITSNAAVPLPLEEGDRRFMVIETPRVPWPTEDYDEVVDWLDNGGDAIAVAWLHRRWDSMSEARRKVLRGRAPDTLAKQALIAGSADGIEGAIRLVLGGNAGVRWPNLMQASDVLFELRTNPKFDLITDSMRKHVNAQRIALAMRAAGAVQLFGGTPIRGKDGKQVRLWCLKAHMVSMYEAMGQTQKLIDRYQAERARSGAPDIEGGCEQSD